MLYTPFVMAEISLDQDQARQGVEYILKPYIFNTSFTQSTVALKPIVLKPLLKLFNVRDSTKEDGIVRHIFA